MLFERAGELAKKLDDQHSGEDMTELEEVLKEARALKERGMRLKDIMENSNELAERLADQPEEDKTKPERKDKRPFANWGEWLQAVHNAGRNKTFDPRLQWFKEETAGGHEEKVFAPHNIVFIDLHIFCGNFPPHPLQHSRTP